MFKENKKHFQKQLFSPANVADGFSFVLSVLPRNSH